MRIATSLSWVERSFFFLLLLGLFLKLFHPSLGIPLFWGAFCFKLASGLLCFFYLAWPWLFALPLDERSGWDRILHFAAPLLWAYQLAAILLARTMIAFMEQGSVQLFYGVVEGLLTLFVLPLSVIRGFRSRSGRATRYYARIIVRVLLIGLLARIAIGWPFGPHG